MVDYPKYEKEPPKEKTVLASMANAFENKEKKPKESEIKEPQELKIIRAQTAAKSILMVFAAAVATFGTRISQGIKQILINRAETKPERDKRKAARKQTRFEKKQANGVKKKAQEEKGGGKFAEMREKQANKNPYKQTHDKFEKESGLKMAPNIVKAGKVQDKEAEKKAKRDAVNKAHNERGFLTFKQLSLLVGTKIWTVSKKVVLYTAAAGAVYFVYSATIGKDPELTKHGKKAAREITVPKALDTSKLQVVYFKKGGTVALSNCMIEGEDRTILNPNVPRKFEVKKGTPVYIVGESYWKGSIKGAIPSAGVGIDASHTRESCSAIFNHTELEPKAADAGKYAKKYTPLPKTSTEKDPQTKGRYISNPSALRM